jgi:hypothetical protein
MTRSTKALSYDYFMTTIGLVASQNGLGHARRLSNLAVGFKQLNLSVKLFLSLFQYKSLQKEFEYSNRKIEIVIIGHHGLDGPTRMMKSVITRPSRDVIFSLKSCRLILSDNLIWPIEYNSNFSLFGHFSWITYWENIGLKNLQETNLESLEKERDFFSSIKNWYFLEEFKFITPSQNKIIFIPIKLLRYHNDSLLPIKTISSDRIWISNGSTNLNKKTVENLNIEIRKRIDYFETFELLKASKKPLLIIGRPGLGTIRDCLAANIPFIPFWYGTDPELESNQNHLERVTGFKFADFNLSDRLNIFAENHKKGEGFCEDRWSELSIEYLEVCKLILEHY